MDPPNAREAMREASADLAEGADLIMVKPACRIWTSCTPCASPCDAPLAAYQSAASTAC